MDNAGSDRPQRRTALVGRELGRYDIQIAALSETRFADVGEIKEVGAGYTFFWSGRKSEERREAGVGFAIKTELVGKLSGLPKGINDRLMTLRLPLSGNKHATIVSAYAPTMTNPDEVKDKFYDDLDNVISATPRTDKLILLGDFNARVGTDHQTWEGVIGPEGVGKCNSNGLLLLRKCAEHDLLITNTVFRLPNRNKTSWMHPRSKHWHLIDYVIVLRTDRQDVKVTKTMCGADCWTDHRLVVSKLNLRIQPARRPQGMIFTARQLQEKCQEQNVDLYMTFVDLTKAFDTVSRDGLWKIMAKFGCPPRFIAMVRQFHDGMQARVQNDGEFSEPFEVTNGVKQGCVLAPTLFSMMFSAMLMDAFQDSDTGFPIRYRFDGNIFNLRRLQAKTKVQTDVLDELLYADDMDKNASTEAKMQRAMDQVSVM